MNASHASLASLQSAVDLLVQARSQHRPADAGLAANIVTTAEQAYVIQDVVARQLGWFSQGPARYWKSGGPSRDSVLTHAPLPPQGVWQSPARTEWDWSMRGIEAEIALRLSVPVDAALAATLDQTGARRLVDAMTVSIEVVDSRWAQKLDAPGLLKLADLQTHGALVLGPWVPYEADRDWAAQRCQVAISGLPSREFRGTHSLADPAHVLPAWLIHATRNGAVLPAGSVVTTGTWCGVLHARPGDTVTATFDGIGEASVQFSPAPAGTAPQATAGQR